MADRGPAALIGLHQLGFGRKKVAGRNFPLDDLFLDLVIDSEIDKRITAAHVDYL